MATVTLLPGKERPVLQRHPWVYSGAIAKVQGYVGRGDAVDVVASSGDWLARGTWSSGSQIRVRLFTWEEHEPLDADLLRRRVERAVVARQRLPDTMRTGSDAMRLIFAESDGLPGLIVDQYGEYLVVQLLTQGMAALSETVFDVLEAVVRPRGIYERSDADVREKESLPPSEGLRRGEEPPEIVQIRQNGLPFAVRLGEGQKTGFYLDQAINRRRVAGYCAGRQVLDCFSYTGGFTVHAALAGAEQITAIDSSELAMATLQENVALNGGYDALEPVTGDVFRLLRQYRHEGRQFDVVILDPPKFAHAQGQVERAARGYKDINLIAMQILRPGGILATFSCSGLVSTDLFQKIVFSAAVDARRDTQVIERLSQSPDHPLLLTFPEGEYLKGLVCRVW